MKTLSPRGFLTAFTVAIAWAVTYGAAPIPVGQRRSIAAYAWTPAPVPARVV